YKSKELPVVYVEFNHDPHSAIVDGTQTRVSGAHLIKTLVWCDNEWGFANRMLDTTLAIATVAFREEASSVCKTFRINKRIHHVCN
ncbi:hypothetical protein DV960_14175, partial [Staphylococcus pseudintermedius]